MNIQEVEKMLLEAKQERLWGSIELDFNDGEIVLVRKMKTTKLRTRKGDRRDEQHTDTNS